MMDLNPSFFIFKGAMCWWGGGTQTVPKYGGALIVGLAAGAVWWWWWWWWWWEGGQLVSYNQTLAPLTALQLSTHQTGQGKAESRWAFK